MNGFEEATSHVFWGGLKEFADGSLGSSTALFHEPYARQKGKGPSSGVRTIATAELANLMKGTDKAGFQAAIHAIGDLAVEEVRQPFNTCLCSASGVAGPRWGICGMSSVGLPVC